MQSHRFIVGLALTGLLAFGLAGRATAQEVAPTTAITVTVDENGHGSIQVPLVSLDPTYPLPTLPDPPLTYALPFAVVPGDVILHEPGSATGTVSDVIRFSPVSGGPVFIALGLQNQVTALSSLVFYSDNSDGGGDLADGALPTSFSDNAVTLDELGSEGSNGAFYTPGPGQPGFVGIELTGLQTDEGYVGGPSLESVQYHFISDVPEPGSLALLATGGLPLLGFLRRRRLTA